MRARFLAVTVGLAGTVSFLVGLIVAGTMTPAPATSAPEPRTVTLRSTRTAASSAAVVSFADVAERLNPTVVNIDATMRGGADGVRPLDSGIPDRFDFFDRRQPAPERETPRRGAGAGFLIDRDGYILTNHHVIADATRISVRLTDGRTLRASPVGSDPDTDIALIKVEAPGAFAYAPLGDSDTLRVGEWVLAIGNPLAYEHTVTVGVVSFIGRKLFDGGLDRYIQTDAAINFGNSGGPLINARGEVIGINAAISSRASNIGFAVPINQAKDILPQLRDTGRVSRGYIGVVPRTVDADLQRSLKLGVSSGALVEDVKATHPADRAGVRPYDVIVAVDGQPVKGSDELIDIIASRTPGTTAILQIVRDGRAMNLRVKPVERLRDDDAAPVPEERPTPSGRRPSPLGLSVRELTDEMARRVGLPSRASGVVVSRVEPLGPAFDADIQRGHVLLEINRRPVRSVEEFRRLVAGVRSGDVLTLYLARAESGQPPSRALHTITVD